MNKKSLLSRKLVLLIISFVSYQLCLCQASGDYRSKQTGAWAAIATWETYNGAAWVNATVAPTAASGAINIVTGHVVTASGSLSANQIIVNTGGTFIISSGTFTLIDTVGAELNCNGNFNFTGGTLSGGGSIEIADGGNFVWDGATINGNIITTINAGAALSMPSGGNILGGSSNPVINNYGDCTWLGGNLTFNNGAPVFNNYGNVNIFTDADINSTNTTTGSFNNKSGGIITKIGSPDDFTFFNGALSFTNDGTININSSFLRFYIPFQHKNLLTVGFGAGAYFTNGNSIFTVSSSVTGEGSLFFDGATAVLNSSTVSVKNIIISNDTVTVSANITISPDCSLTLSNGVLTGNGNIGFSGGSTFNWNGGENSGSGTITVDANALITMGYPGRTIAQTKKVNNYGTCNWDDGALTFSNGTPAFNNYGIFNIDSDDVLVGANNNTGTFINHPGGTINKEGAPGGYSNFYGTGSFINRGVVNINSSTILIQFNSYHYGSVATYLGSAFDLRADTALMFSGMNVSGDGLLIFSGATAIVNEAVFKVKTINITSGKVTADYSSTVDSGCTVNFSNGLLDGIGDIMFKSGSNFYWSGGTNGGSSIVTIDPGATFIMNGGTLNFTGTKKLNNYGNWIWDDGNVILTDAPEINNYASLQVNADANFYVSNGSGGVFNNQATGSIVKEGSPSGQTLINGIGSFNNYGNINVQSGNINLSVNGIHAGTYNILFGGELSGNINLPFTGISFNNDGLVSLTNLSFNGNISQYLNGDGVIESTVVNNTTSVILTEAQTITNNLTVSPGAKLLVNKDLIVQ